MNVAETNCVFAAENQNAEPAFATAAHAAEAAPVAQPANPFRRRQADLYSAFLGAISADGLQAIAAKLQEQAASGNVTVTPGTASLTLTAFAPTVLTPRLVTPGTATLALMPGCPRSRRCGGPDW